MPKFVTCKVDTHKFGRLSNLWSMTALSDLVMEIVLSSLAFQMTPITGRWSNFFKFIFFILFWVYTNSCVVSSMNYLQSILSVLLAKYKNTPVKLFAVGFEPSVIAHLCESAAKHCFDINFVVTVWSCNIMYKKFVILGICVKSQFNKLEQKCVWCDRTLTICVFISFSGMSWWRLYSLYTLFG